MTASSLRIKGLVRFERALRRQIAQGFDAAERRAWRERTEQVLQRVDAICRAHGTTPEALPAPSRRAYRFLASIAWEDLPAAPPPAADAAPRREIPPGETIRVRNLLRHCRALHRRMQSLAEGAPQAPSRADLLCDIRRLERKARTLAENLGASPADFAPPSRRAYAWLHYLSDPAHLKTHLKTLERLLSLARRDAAEVDLFYSASLYTLRKGPDGVRAVFSEGLAGAPAPVLRAAAALLRGNMTPKQRERLHSYTESEAYRAVLRALQAAVRSEQEARGLVYDLNALFDELNAQYFEGALPRPRLRWSGRITRRKFGHYEPASDTILLSSTLDDPAVPRYATAFVLYHEMLHKFVGVKKINGRRYAHTRAFRRLERLFEQYEEAQAVLRQLALEED